MMSTHWWIHVLAEQPWSNPTSTWQSELRFESSWRHNLIESRKKLDRISHSTRLSYTCTLESHTEGGDGSQIVPSCCLIVAIIVFSRNSASSLFWCSSFILHLPSTAQNHPSSHTCQPPIWHVLLTTASSFPWYSFVFLVLTMFAKALIPCQVIFNTKKIFVVEVFRKVSHLRNFVTSQNLS